MTLKQLIKYTVVCGLCFTSCSSFFRADPMPQHIFLLAPQLLGSPTLFVDTSLSGELTFRYGTPVSSEMFKYWYGSYRELENSEDKTLDNEILNALGKNINDIELQICYYDVASAGSSVFYADAKLFGREPGQDLSDLLFNYHAALRVTKEYHFDGYFKRGEISLKEWLKEGDLIMATSQNTTFYFLMSPPESLSGVTFTLELPVKYADSWSQYTGDVPYPEKPETTLVCSATLPSTE